MLSKPSIWADLPRDIVNMICNVAANDERDTRDAVRQLCKSIRTAHDNAIGLKIFKNHVNTEGVEFGTVSPRIALFVDTSTLDLDILNANFKSCIETICIMFEESKPNTITFLPDYRSLKSISIKIRNNDTLVLHEDVASRLISFSVISITIGDTYSNWISMLMEDGRRTTGCSADVLALFTSLQSLDLTNMNFDLYNVSSMTSLTRLELHEWYYGDRDRQTLLQSLSGLLLLRHLSLCDVCSCHWIDDGYTYGPSFVDKAFALAKTMEETWDFTYLKNLKSLESLNVAGMSVIGISCLEWLTHLDVTSCFMHPDEPWMRGTRLQSLSLSGFLLHPVDTFLDKCVGLQHIAIDSMWSNFMVERNRDSEWNALERLNVTSIYTFLHSIVLFDPSKLERLTHLDLTNEDGDNLVIGAIAERNECSEEAIVDVIWDRIAGCKALEEVRIMELSDNPPHGVPIGYLTMYWPSAGGQRCLSRLIARGVRISVVKSNYI